jgi:peroxiredoxin
MDRVEQQGVELWQRIIEKRAASGMAEAPPEQDQQHRCPNCQAVLPKPVNVCPHCGQSTIKARILPQSADEQPVGDPSAMNLPDAAKGLASIRGAQQRAKKLIRGRRLRTLDILIIIAIVLILIGVAAVVSLQLGILDSALSLIKPSQPQQPVQQVKPVFSNLMVTEPTSSETSLSWNTETEVYGKVLYGKTDAYGLSRQEGFKSTSHKIQLQELEPGTSYHFVILSVDREDKVLARGTDSVFTTKPLPTKPSPLVISQLKVIPTDISAIVRWTTDRPSSSQVAYGPSASCDLSTPVDSKLVTSHSLKISGMEVNTPYYYRVKSISADGVESSMSTPEVFTTLVSVPTGSRIGERAPDFTLPTFKTMESVSLRNYRGQKVLLTFWAVYCPECDRELALLQTLKNRNLPGVVVLAIFMESKLDDIEKTVNKFKADRGDLTVPVLVDMYKTTAHMYSVDRAPFTVFIDSDRIIREIEFGSFNLDQVEQTLNSL